MNQTQLTNRVWGDVGSPMKVSKRLISKIISATFTAIQYELIKDREKLVLRGFGTFIVRKIPAHRSWIIDKFVDIPKRERIGFKMAKNIKRELNAK